MDAHDQGQPPDEVRRPVEAAPIPAGSAAGPAVAAPTTCVVPPPAATARRRFWAVVVPSLAVALFAWVALVRWGGDREMRRGLLTGGPPLMSGEHAHGGTDAALAGAVLGEAPPEVANAGGSMAMLGFDLHGLAPASAAYAGVFLLMWTVMIVAMMLPATLPSVRVFLGGDRTRLPRSGAAFLLGCLLTWSLAGVAVYALLGVFEAALPTDGSELALGVGTACLLLAGLFQFSRAKERVLAHVRGPFSCGDGSWRAGLHHGRRCLVSCGPYMVAVALLGMMSLFWMAVFALVMLVEQAAEMRAGRGMLVSRAVGAVTVFVAMGLFLSPTPLPLVG
jgi:predicted metal-binding membrane protein